MVSHCSVTGQHGCALHQVWLWTDWRGEREDWCLPGAGHRAPSIMPMATPSCCCCSQSGMWICPAAISQHDTLPQPPSHHKSITSHHPHPCCRYYHWAVCVLISGHWIEQQQDEERNVWSWMSRSWRHKSGTPAAMSPGHTKAQYCLPGVPDSEDRSWSPAAIQILNIKHKTLPLMSTAMINPCRSR